jgi:hypothetical protein
MFNEIISWRKMLKKIVPILLALNVLITACGPLTLPTMAPADVLGTSVAGTLTMVAATQAAIPTNTLPPPTETATPSPTLEPTITLTPISDSNNCTKALNVGQAGPTKNVRIENENTGQANISLNLVNPNLFGQCGALSYTIKGKAKMNIQIPSGSWWVYAWVSNPDSQPAPVSFTIGASKSTDLLRIVIRKDVIVWVGP